MQLKPPSDHTQNVDVIIVGAGAAGLTLAIDLARRGVSFRLIDKLVAPFSGSRGKGLQPRTQEVFEDLGLIERIKAVGGYYPPQRDQHADGHAADVQDMAFDPPTSQEPYRTPLLVPQMATEAVMRWRLGALGHAPEYGTALQSFQQSDQEVFAVISTKDGLQTVACRYLIGADGGRSFVRRALELGFPGKTLGVKAIVADVRLAGLSRDAWHRFSEGDMGRQVSFCPLPHTDLFQLQAPVPLECEADLSISGLQAFIDARAPDGGVTVLSVDWASAYVMNARLADRFRVGRVLLVGDAAHIHPPTGGQGLNTSVQDAYNLGWKLSAVLSGAPDRLLDTYEEERRPIAADMLGLSTELLDRAKRGDMRRGREVHQLDLGYPWSSLSLESPDRAAGVLAGDRAPDAKLRDVDDQPLRLFDLYRGPHWSLVDYGSSPAIQPPPGALVKIISIGPGRPLQDEGEDFAAAYGVRDGDLVLVRPDGYVAAVVEKAKSDAVADYLARVMGPV